MNSEHHNPYIVTSEAIISAGRANEDATAQLERDIEAFEKKHGSDRAVYSSWLGETKVFGLHFSEPPGGPWRRARER